MSRDDNHPGTLSVPRPKRGRNMKINKEAPPGRFQYDWDEIVEMAEANPGVWIKPDREYPHSLYTALVRGKNSRFPPGEYEFRTSGTRYDIEGKRWVHLHFRKINKRASNA